MWLACDQHTCSALAHHGIEKGAHLRCITKKRQEYWNQFLRLLFIVSHTGSFQHAGYHDWPVSHCLTAWVSTKCPSLSPPLARSVPLAGIPLIGSLIGQDLFLLCFWRNFDQSES